jgi:hypothetical protein
LHGVLLLCREIGLIDNITEHLDVMRCFELMLHRKRGRLGPAGGKGGVAAAVGGAVGGTGSAVSSAAGDAAARVDGASTPIQAEQQQQLSNDSCAAADANTSTTDTIRVVHVVRPGVSAATAAAAAAGAAASEAARGSNSRPCSGRFSAGVPPGSAASRVLNVDSLEAAEVLELLLLVSGDCRLLRGIAADFQAELHLHPPVLRGL